MQVSHFPAAAAGDNWFNTPGVEGPPDDQFTICYIDTADPLVLSDFRGSGYPTDDIRTNSEIKGLTITIEALMGALNRHTMLDEGPRIPNTDPEPDPSELDYFRVGISLDGGATVASEWRMFNVGWHSQWRDADDYDAPQLIVLGGVSDLWGLTGITPDQLNSTDFALVIERVDDPGATPGDCLFGSAEREVAYQAINSMFPFRDNPRQVSIFRLEDTPGAIDNGATPIKLNGMRVQFNPVVQKSPHSRGGEKHTSHHPTEREHSTASAVNTKLNYDEFGLLLMMLCGAPVTSEVAAGAYRHVFSLKRLKRDLIKTMSHNYGELGTNGEQVLYAFLSSLNMEFGKATTSFGASFMGRKMDYDAALPDGVNEVQTMTHSLSPNSGALTLKYRGEPLAAVDGAADMTADLQNAFDACTMAVEDGGITVARTSATVYTFTGANGQNLPMIEIVSNTMAVTTTIAETTRGGWKEFDIVPILAGHWQTYIATTFAGLSAGHLANCFLTNVTANNRAGIVHAGDRSVGTNFKALAEQPLEIGLEVRVPSGPDAVTLAGYSRNDTGFFSRINALGPEVVGGVNYELNIDAAVKVSADNNFEVDEEVESKSFTMAPRFDPTWGKVMEFTLVNGVATYLI